MQTLALSQHQINRPAADYSYLDNYTPVGNGID